MAQWKKLSPVGPTAVDERTITLLDQGNREVYFLTEKVDWEGNVLEREGDERLLPIMQLSVDIQEAAGMAIDPDIIKRNAAPIIAEVLTEISGQELDVDDIMETMEFSMDGSWQARTRPIGTRIEGPPKMKRLN